MGLEFDQRVRATAFSWLAEQVRILGEDVLPWSLLKEGFPFESERVHLVARQGIFKPRQLDFPLTIMTSPEDPYRDSIGPDGTLHYRYQGTDPNRHDNRGLKEACKRGLPLIYLHGVDVGRYLALWPVYILRPDDADLVFHVDVRRDYLRLESGESLTSDPVERRYTERWVRQRLHQPAFRERVLRAYRERCAMCRLGHRRLLDAAHIVADRDPQGTPRVPNGLALCKLHHAAFDNHFVGIRPDLVLEVRREILDEEDGPMLLHGLKGLQGSTLHTPRSKRNRPDEELLEIRWETFRRSA